jgi:hypothetical protein
MSLGRVFFQTAGTKMILLYLFLRKFYEEKFEFPAKITLPQNISSSKHTLRLGLRVLRRGGLWGGRKVEEKIEKSFTFFRVFL